MKQTLLSLLLLPVCNIAISQNFEPLQVASGFNSDVIANGIGTALSSTTASVDNANFCLMAANFQVTAAQTPPSYALPVSGLLTSPLNANLTYQFASYSSFNSLRLVDQNDTGTLVFSNQLAATNIYFLVTSGSGASSLAGIITFADNTTQAFTAPTIPDWFFSNALPIVVSGIGRVGRLDNTIENPVGDPRLYHLDIPIAFANQTKLISSVQLTKSSVLEGVANIFAVSAKLSLLGIENYDNATFSVYPNPMNDLVTVSGNENIREATIINMLGQEVFSQKGNGDQQLSLSTSSLPFGNYVLTIVTDHGTVSKNLIKK